jgi:hypothetical protein
MTLWQMALVGTTLIGAGLLIVSILILLLVSWKASRRNHSPQPTNPLPRSGPAPDLPPPTGTASAPSGSPLPDRFRWIFEKYPDGDTSRKET